MKLLGFLKAVMTALIISQLFTGWVFGKTKKVSNNQTKEKTKLTKTPKSLFLVKRASIESAGTEPNLYPYQLQEKTIIYDKFLDKPTQVK